MKPTKYRYYSSLDHTSRGRKESEGGADQLGRERLNPSWSNPDYLILRKRRRLISNWLSKIQGDRLLVLDVGGRIQPYRELLEGRLAHYIAIDPQFEGLVDVVSVGENLPFAGDMFDIVICTQVLGYALDPFAVIQEIYRVLKPGAALLFTVPEFSIRHHDERWRFLPEGLRTLFSGFSHVEIRPEGYSVYGFFRTVNTCLYFFPETDWIRKILSFTLIPVFNIAGLLIEKIHPGNEKLVVNNCVFARK